MAPEPSEIILTLEQITEPETGIWCDRCNLPSVVRCLMALRDGDKLLHVGTHERCMDCPDENVMMDGKSGS